MFSAGTVPTSQQEADPLAMVLLHSPLQHQWDMHPRLVTDQGAQQSTDNRSCSCSAPHHQSPARAKEELPAGHSVPSSPPKWCSSPSPQSTYKREAGEPKKSKGFQRRHGFSTAQQPLRDRALQQKAFTLINIIWRGKKSTNQGRKKPIQTHTHF